jgi:hypothetical protein
MCCAAPAAGFNRTGFVVCSYLIECCGLSVDEAMESFAEARPPGVKHEKFINELYARYGHGAGSWRRSSSWPRQLGAANGASDSVGGEADVCNCAETGAVAGWGPEQEQGRWRGADGNGGAAAAAGRQLSAGGLASRSRSSSRHDMRSRSGSQQDFGLQQAQQAQQQLGSDGAALAHEDGRCGFGGGSPLAGCLGVSCRGQAGSQHAPSWSGPDRL